VEADEAEEEDTGPEQAVLTEEDEKIWFTKPYFNDLTETTLDKSFSDFSIPEKSEGFDEINFEWQGEKESKDYVQKWVLERKRTSRMEYLQPSQWFKTQDIECTRKVHEWQAKQKAAREVSTKKPEDEDDEPERDLFTIEDICNVGDGEPLFLNFTPEDWALMSIRWELHLLATAFRKDANDPDRTEIPEQHMAFYYYKYFRKNLAPKGYGKDTLEELVGMFKGTVELNGEPGMFSTKLPEDTTPETIVKYTEENRRERQRRVDAGDETARLTFSASNLSSYQYERSRDEGRHRGGKGESGKGYFYGKRGGKRR